jgi:hypothetical protein
MPSGVLHQSQDKTWLTALLARRPTKVAAIRFPKARENGLGHDGQGRAIQGTSRACGVNEIAPDNRLDVKVGKANST